MAKLAVLDKTGKKVSDIELKDEIFAIEPNKSAMHLVVVNYLANQRQGTQSTLTRSEVSGGGKKPWKQKGTGRARQGSTRAPQWTHGGIALNVYDILNCNTIVVLKDAVAKIEEVYA